MTSFGRSVVLPSASASPRRGDPFFVPTRDAILHGSRPVIIYFSINKTPTDIHMSAPLHVTVTSMGMASIADEI
jgi:hypothetical protein